MHPEYFCSPWNHVVMDIMGLLEGEYLDPHKNVHWMFIVALFIISKT
jgi:hypothetical protein